jgi:hypothetical protein
MSEVKHGFSIKCQTFSQAEFLYQLAIGLDWKLKGSKSMYTLDEFSTYKGNVNFWIEEYGYKLFWISCARDEYKIHPFSTKTAISLLTGKEAETENPFTCETKADLKIDQVSFDNLASDGTARYRFKFTDGSITPNSSKNWHLSNTDNPYLQLMKDWFNKYENAKSPNGNNQEKLSIKKVIADTKDIFECIFSDGKIIRESQAMIESLLMCHPPEHKEYYKLLYEYFLNKANEEFAKTQKPKENTSIAFLGSLKDEFIQYSNLEKKYLKAKKQKEALISEIERMYSLDWKGKRFKHIMKELKNVAEA